MTPPLCPYGCIDDGCKHLFACFSISFPEEGAFYGGPSSGALYGLAELESVIHGVHDSVLAAYLEGTRTANELMLSPWVAWMRPSAILLELAGSLLERVPEALEEMSPRACFEWKGALRDSWAIRNCIDELAIAAEIPWDGVESEFDAPGQSTDLELRYVEDTEEALQQVAKYLRRFNVPEEGYDELLTPEARSDPEEPPGS